MRKLLFLSTVLLSALPVTAGRLGLDDRIAFDARRYRPPCNSHNRGVSF